MENLGRRRRITGVKSALALAPNFFVHVTTLSCLVHALMESENNKKYS
jgi:hypothetical protein